MSDFDKEAERERLREQYERDEEKREVTERMSELLLKGATMTNAHCQDCGDPIFRYDGQEFCATCQKAVQRDTGDGTGDGSADGEDHDDAAANSDREEIHVTAPDETHVQFGGDDQPTADPAEETAAGPSEDAATAGQPDENVATDDQPAADTRQETGVTAPQRPAPQNSGTATGEHGDLVAAHAALSREVTRLARQAEATDDLGQKRALLAATEEAAEALAAVQNAGR